MAIIRGILLLLLLVLYGCGGSAAPSGTANSPSGPGTGSTTAASSGRGLALSISVKRLPNRTLLRGEEITEALIDVLDPVTLQATVPTTRVVRDPAAAVQSTRIEVPTGTWLVRVQGRTVTGEAAGTRFQAPATVSESQVTRVEAELNPLTDLTGLQVSPGPEVALALGTTRQFVATGIRSDQTSENVTNNVQWSSSNVQVAAVTPSGLVNATGEGTALITARTASLTATSTVIVSRTQLRALQIDPPQLTLTPGLTRQLTATGVFSDNTNQNLTNQVNWSTSAPTLASVTPTGLVIAVAPGNVTIRAQQGAVTATAQLQIQVTLTRLEVSPVSSELPAGKTQQLKATGFFNDNTTQDLTTSVIWTSGDAQVASISASGLVTALVPGSVNITASSANQSASARVMVTPAVLVSLALSPSNATVPKGGTLSLRATGTFSDSTTRDLTQSATWTSTNTSAATVSNANGTRGVVSAGNVGQAVIEATQDGVSNATSVTVSAAALVSLDVRPANASVTSGSSLQYQAFGTFSDSSTLDVTQNVTWTSTVPTVGAISNANGTQGLATGLSAGTTGIVASSAGSGVSSSTQLTVNAVPGPPPPAVTPTPSLILISRRDPTVAPPGSGSGNGDSTAFQSSSMSADGRYVAFVSTADDLVPFDTNGASDAFRFDTQTLTMIRVSLDNVGAGGQIGAGASACSISATGQYVAFQSFQNLIVPGDLNGQNDIFRRDCVNNITVGVSLVDGTTNPTVSGAAGSLKPSISADGNRVAFISNTIQELTTNIDLNTSNDVFVRDILANSTRMCSANSVGTAGNGFSDEPALSGNGLFVTFRSSADDLVALVPDPNGNTDIFRYDIGGDSTLLCSADAAGGYVVPGPNAGDCLNPSISFDGRWVAMQCGARLVPATDTNALDDIYRRDCNLTPNASVLVSLSSTGVVSTVALSAFPSVSDDGRFVSFESQATDLVVPDANGGLSDIFLRDVTGSSTSLVSRSAAGVQSDGASTFGRVSANGRYLTLVSRGTNLDPLKINALFTDLFERRNLLAP